jgi:hypothetical protein
VLLDELQTDLDADDLAHIGRRGVLCVFIALIVLLGLLQKLFEVDLVFLFDFLLDVSLKGALHAVARGDWWGLGQLEGGRWQEGMGGLGLEQGEFEGGLRLRGV